MSDRDDDLFSPSLTQRGRRDLPPGQKPWRLGSQFYVAFFGGPLAAGAVGFLNGRRLGLPRERLWMIAGIGVAGFVAAIAIAATFFDTAAARSPRLAVAVAGIASYLAARELQKDADHLYGAGRDDDQAYDSLWAAGLGAVLVCGIFSLIVLTGVT